MIEVWLGYPGVGLREYAGFFKDTPTIHWQDALDLDAIKVDTDDKVIVMAPLNQEALEGLKGKRIDVRVFYPSPESYGEYEERMLAEGLEATVVAELLSTMDTDLQTMRESTQPRVRHCVLGRGELVLGIV